MGLNDTPSANRIHIGFFGRRNAGKSSLMNAVTGQEIAVVSDILGTTTDPVSKAMELLPLGPVMMIDTAGFDDEGELGELRIKKTKQVLNKTDVAVLVASAAESLSACDNELLSLFKAKNIPYIIALNKSDLKNFSEPAPQNSIFVSAKTGAGIHELKEKIGALANVADEKMRICADLLHPSDFVVLVVPIDKAAPKGRLILPQQQTIRDILEADATAVVVKEHELRQTLDSLGKKPAMVITDSQVFAKVSADTPRDIPLTSFSILMARYKGFLDEAVHGAAAIAKLRDGDKVLICEGCTHHRQCDDIGSVKLPRWLKQYSGAAIDISLCSGVDFPEDLSPYALIIHCGGCMLTAREVTYRMKCAADAGVPITNYGTAIAFMQGILRRSIELFPYLLDEVDENAD